MEQAEEGLGVFTWATDLFRDMEISKWLVQAEVLGE